MTHPSPRNKPPSSLTVPLLMLLAGCQTVPSNSCGVLYTYSTDFQRQAAVELKEIQAGAPHVAQLMDDYGKTRDTIRACR